MIDGAGVYQIVHIATGRRYVGQAKNVNRRWREHRRDLAKGGHTSLHLQRAWIKYGPDAFQFTLLHSCNEIMLDELEQHELDAGAVFNVLKYARSPRGVARRDETKQRISAALRGKEKSAAHRAALSAANLGKRQSAEVRAKKSATQKGRAHSPEHRAKLAAANKARTGYRHTPE